MKVIVLPDVGFCYGVKRSIDFCKEHKDSKKALFLLGMLVHNDLVNKSLLQNGFQMIENDNDLLYQLKKHQDGIFISTAHGISEKTKKRIIDAGAKLIDTTCPVVNENRQKIIRYYQNGYDIIYIGKKGHAEGEAVKEYIHLIENDSDINQLLIQNPNIVIMNQTTMSEMDFKSLIPLIHQKYPWALEDLCICPFTLKRQKNVLEEINLHHSCHDKWLVVGDIKSNNTNKLFELIKDHTNNCYLVNSVLEIMPLKLSSDDTIYICSGTSTPNQLIEEIKEYLLII